MAPKSGNVKAKKTPAKKDELVCRCKQPAPPKVPGRTFVDMNNTNGSATFRITFTCNPQDYFSIADEIRAYGNIEKEEQEIKC